MLLARAEGMHYFTPEGRPVLYRVRLGPISTVAEYDKLAARLASLGFPEARLASD